MEFVKVGTTYYNEPALVAAGDDAELLFMRALAYSGDRTTDGFIPSAMAARLTPTKTAARVTALVREGLWTTVDGGWQITDWDNPDSPFHQVLKAKLEAKREDTRKRVAAHRQRRKDAASNALHGGLLNGDVTPQEVEAEIEAAAAASRATQASAPTEAPSLPPQLEILKAKLDAHQMIVRWDKLTAEQRDSIADLVDLHGDSPLIKAARNAYRPDSPPAFAQAWLSTWQAIPAAGRLQLVQAPPCPLGGHTGTTEACNQCAAERKAVPGR